MLKKTKQNHNSDWIWRAMRRRHRNAKDSVDETPDFYERRKIAIPHGRSVGQNACQRIFKFQLHLLEWWPRQQQQQQPHRTLWADLKLPCLLFLCLCRSFSFSFVRCVTIRRLRCCLYDEWIYSILGFLFLSRDTPNNEWNDCMNGKEERERESKTKMGNLMKMIEQTKFSFSWIHLFAIACACIKCCNK